MAEPQGFTVPTASELDTEHRRARYNDQTNPQGNSFNVTTFLYPNTAGYEVSEEERNNPFAGNVRLQSVRIGVSRGSATPASATAVLENFDLVTGERHMLIGDSDGTVRLLSTSGGIITHNQIALDITNAAAAAGLTANQIRQMQQRISFDGEVDRSEQLEIINIIARANEIARGEQPAR